MENNKTKNHTIILHELLVSIIHIKPPNVRLVLPASTTNPYPSDEKQSERTNKKQRIYLIFHCPWVANQPNLTPISKQRLQPTKLGFMDIITSPIHTDPQDIMEHSRNTPQNHTLTASASRNLKLEKQRFLIDSCHTHKSERKGETWCRNRMRWDGDWAEKANTSSSPPCQRWRIWASPATTPSSSRLLYLSSPSLLSSLPSRRHRRLLWFLLLQVWIV